MKSTSLKFITISLLFFAFFSCSYNAFFNGHYHRIENGLLVFHAHPFEDTEKGSTPSHTHSKLDLLNYELLASLLFSLVIILFVFHFVLRPSSSLPQIQLFDTIELLILQANHYRGPPSVT